MTATKFKGFSVTLSCKISNVASPAYYWLKDGRNVTGGTVDSSSVAKFTIESVQFKDMGNYSCVATDTNTANSWTSATATLSVQGTVFPVTILTYDIVIIQYIHVLVIYVANILIFKKVI